MEQIPKEILGDNLNGKKLFLVAATLCPETMYGQTNCFVGPALKYGFFIVNDTDIYVCTYRAARNMGFQGISNPRGDSVGGSQIMRTKIKAPFAILPEVYSLGGVVGYTPYGLRGVRQPPYVSPQFDILAPYVTRSRAR